MAETVEEQMFYGDHCIHGRNLGTPGGADLMCYGCEMGYTKWVEDPGYGLFFTFGEPLVAPPPLHRSFFQWRASSIDHAWERIRNYVNSLRDDWWATVPEEMNWQVFQVDNGYWDQP